jgi:hypothetical protein
MIRLLAILALIPSLAFGATTIVSRAVVANTNSVIVSHTNLTLNGTATVNAVKFNDATVQTTAALPLTGGIMTGPFTNKSLGEIRFQTGGGADKYIFGSNTFNALVAMTLSSRLDGYLWGVSSVGAITGASLSVVGGVSASSFTGNGAGLTNVTDVTNRVLAGALGGVRVTNAGGNAYAELHDYDGWRWINPWAGSGASLNSGGGISYPMDSSAGPYTLYMAGAADAVGVAFPIPPHASASQVTVKVRFRTHYGHLTNQTVRLGFMRPPFAVHYASYGATMVGMMTNTFETNFPISVDTPAVYILREGAVDTDTGRVDIIQTFWKYGP